ncbi:hypothetical protein DAEQUDRAFT_733650 [Daedalea quercina L-15889]|uniref:Uncharacterized protein n=1 Tax=Daedalea quercina L-15889 TaxID=1314783 RepID=A0A165KUI9_9APHY|nr:hypothetical protein DAEQUDRAFT_733650 [Daedalea quercina L-15889]
MCASAILCSTTFGSVWKSIYYSHSPHLQLLDLRCVILCSGHRSRRIGQRGDPIVTRFANGPGRVCCSEQHRNWFVHEMNIVCDRGERRHALVAQGRGQHLLQRLASLEPRADTIPSGDSCVVIDQTAILIHVSSPNFLCWNTEMPVQYCNILAGKAYCIKNSCMQHALQDELMARLELQQVSSEC